MSNDARDGIVDEQVVREALGRLCTRGVEPWWVREQEVLLRLTCVSARVESSDDLDSRVDALVEILRELVGRIRHLSHGSILWVVLGLEDRYLRMGSAEQRRECAGRIFRGGERPVSAGTIRQHHEKRALDRLTAMLVEYERTTSLVGFRPQPPASPARLPPTLLDDAG
jgi:hypothetical protein